MLAREVTGNEFGIPKDASKIRRQGKEDRLIAPKIDAWRRHQPDMPNVLQAIRTLVEKGIEADRREKKGGH